MSRPIEHEHMVAVLAKEGQLIVNEMTAMDAHNMHMAVGISGEVGELLEAFNAVFSHGKDMDRVNVVEELGDAEFYIEGLRQGYCITRAETLEGIRVIDNDSVNSLIGVSNGIVIHASQILDIVKKGVIYRKAIPREVIVDGLGWLEFYLDRARTILNITREETIEANINKLGIRYAGFEYSDESAQKRADKEDGE